MKEPEQEISCSGVFLPEDPVPKPINIAKK